MAATAPPLWPGASTFPGTDVYPGQGTQPLVWFLYSTDDASVEHPAWQDASAKVRSFVANGGRSTEFATVDAGTCTVTVDNRDRDLDPSVSGIRPLSQVWLREQFVSETQGVFRGFVQSVKLDYPPPGFGDAIAELDCADEFAVLNMDSLPTTSPPRVSYDEVVQSDNPAGFWPFDNPPETRVQTADIPPDEPTPTAVTPPAPGTPEYVATRPLHIGDPWA